MEPPYKIGDIVYCRYYKDRTDLAEVIEVDDYSNGVRVRWLKDNKESFMDYGEIRINDPVADAAREAAIQAKIDEATSAFEKAFQAFKEAGELAGGEVYEIKNEKVDLTKFHNAINSAGWSTSSLYC